MALANLAECFREKGLRTIMIDWDLEAPGLESYFYPANSPEIAAIQSQNGLIDLLQLYKTSYASIAAPPRTSAGAAAAEGETKSRLPTFLQSAASPPGEVSSSVSFADRVARSMPPIESYLREMQPTPGGGKLYLLPAGNRRNPGFGKYVTQVQNFDWTGFYARYDGKEFFEWLRSCLEKLSDVILIDSRTGVTEMGGVCTRQLADVVVSFCAPNSQNVDGTVRINESLLPQNAEPVRSQRALQLLVVPTRIDTTESDRLGDFQTRFRESFQISDRIPIVLRKQQDPFWSLQIPYIARFNYREERVIGPGSPEVKAPTDQLVDAYRRIAAALAAVAAPTHIVREKFSTEIPRYFRALGPQLLLAYEGPEGAAMGAILLAELSRAQIPVWPDLDNRDVFSGWQAAIDRTLALIVLQSPASGDSEALRREVRYARQQGKPVYVVTDGAASVSSLPVWATGLPIDTLAQPAVLLDRLGGSQTTQRIPYMAPAPAPEMIRRDAFDAVRKLVIQGSPCVVLNGPVGSGSRTLAAQICDDATVAASFPEGILWLDIGESPNLADKWRELFLALYGDVSIPSDPEIIRRQLGSHLTSGRFLLVLNDVRSQKQLAELPFTGKLLKTLVIARVRDWRPPAIPFTLGPLSPREAVELLRVFAPVEENLALRIAEGAGNMPLTVAAAGAAFRYLPSAEPQVVWTLVLDTLLRDGVTGFDPMGPNIAVGLALQAQLSRLDRVNRVRMVQFAELQQTAFCVRDVMERLQLGQSSAVALLQELHNLFLVTFEPDANAVENGKVSPDALVWRYLRRPAASPRTGSRRAVMSAKDAHRNPDVKQARFVLEGREAVTASQASELADKLKKQRYFELARLLLAKAWDLLRSDADESLALRIAQQWALCTYKDTQLPVYQRLFQALDILNSRAGLKDSTNPETLGIAGAIHKELWKYDAQRATLERSLSFYARGAANGLRADYGYTALNAAFVQDLLASQEDRDRSASAPSTGALRIEDAQRYRKQIASELPLIMNETGGEWLRDQWWVLVTLGEALFGLRRYDDALHWLKLALQHRGTDWEYEATARQLATLSNLVEDSDAPEEEKTAARETLRFFLGNDAAIAASLRLGKVGLALSGGGFRASLFHIGVLARLAELDLLRHVEVLSCVSGGAIVGAHYYLELRNLLQSKPDWQIARQDYIDIVDRIARDFTAGVQRNLRTRLALNPWVSLKTALKPHYTRTERLGEMYEEYIFRSAFPAGSAPRELWLDGEQLAVQPPGEPDDFSPKLDNWRRSSKVPNLILNATTLNTGHNWQFGITWMGEPPYTVSSEVDATERLRRMYYWEAPERYRKVRLGHAVAASSCVPSLFEPLALPGLYPDRTVQLVDGGVHDNQGTASLLEQECTVLLVSDASGQMLAEHRPSPELLGVPLRANSILQARLREAELVDLQARRRASVLRGLLFLHLKMDLESPSVDWVRPDAAAQEPKVVPAQPVKTAYGIDREAQESLATLRTDLDSFNDQEAGALMLSGYRMASYYLPEALPAIPPSTGAPDWWFLQMTRQLEGTSLAASDRNWTLRILNAGKCLTFRSIRLLPALRFAVIALILMLVVSWVWSLQHSGNLLQAFGLLVVLILPSVAALALLGWLLRWLRVKSLTQFAIGLVSVPGMLFATVQMLVFDPLYLYLGRMPRPGAKRISGAGVTVRLMVFLIALILLAAGPWIPTAWTQWQVMRVRNTASQLQSGKNYAAALPAWNDLLTLHPDDSDALRQQGFDYLQLSNWDKAIQDYVTLDRVAGLNLNEYKLRAYARLQSGDLRGALEDYTRVIAANPDDRDAIAQRDTILQRLPVADPVPPLRALVAAKPRIYVQVATPQQKTGFASLASHLQALGYDVPQVEVVGNRAPSTTQIRLSANDQDDINKAGALIEQLRQQGINAAGPYVLNADKPRPNVYELWIAPTVPESNPK
jgi:predicted acylesterase/phospholipase RssA